MGQRLLWFIHLQTRNDIVVVVICSGHGVLSTKFGANNEEQTKAVSSTKWQFLRLTVKLSDN